MEQSRAVPLVIENDTTVNRTRTDPGIGLQPAIRQAIESMHERYGEPITLTELAAEVYVSPFHFSRIFARATGVTPGRYLTAVRLFEAKRLLLTTNLTVSDIVCGVGYSSVGTFTSRFTRAVGMTPTQYRDPEVGRLLVALAPRFRRLPPLWAVYQAGHHCASLRGGAAELGVRLDMPRGCAPAELLVCVFADVIPQSGPVAFAALGATGSADLVVPAVPDGTWNVLAVAEHAAGTPGSYFSVGTTRHPVTVRAGEPAHVRLRLREPQPTDPPIAITLAGRPGPATNRMTTELRGVA